VKHQIRHTAEKIKRRIALVEPLAHRRRRALPSFRYRPLSGPGNEPELGGAIDPEWPPIEPHTYWGEPQRDFALHSSFDVPAEWDAGAPVALYLPIGDAGDFSHPEALVFIDGHPISGCDRHHDEVRLGARWRDGKRHDLTLHGWTGLGGSTSAHPGTRLFMRPSAVVQIDQAVRDFIGTARVALGTAMAMDSNDPVKARLLTALDESFQVLDTRDPLTKHVYATVARAHELLLSGIERAGRPLDVEIVATGHAHLDVAWLWTLGQTRRKAGRTFHTVLALMEEFPEFHFTQSQPQLYEYVREDYPELFESLRKSVSEGRWEPTGGMWVEADCNITGAESLVRQFLLGRTSLQSNSGPRATPPFSGCPTCSAAAGRFLNSSNKRGSSTS
jgi:alpha-mannosidase